MSRKLQHISTRGEVDDAGREGEKVEAMCRTKVYAMTGMKDSIPTCTKCATLLREELNRYRLQPTTWTWTATTNLATTFGGGK